MLNVGILGLGGISQAHVSGWLNTKDARVVAVCDIRPQQLTRPVEQTGAKAYTDFETMMSREKLDIKAGYPGYLPAYLLAQRIRGKGHGQRMPCAVRKTRRAGFCRP